MGNSMASTISSSDYRALNAGISPGIKSGNNAAADERPEKRITSVENVQISGDARKALSDELAREPVYDFLEENLPDILQESVGRLVEYPTPLASMLDDMSLSTEQRGEAMSALNVRELEAFGKYAKESPSNLEMYYIKYVEYLDSLPPEELNSGRYAGQRAQAVAAYGQVSGGSEPVDLSENQDPIIRLLEMIQEEDLKVEEMRDLLSNYKDEMAPILDRENSERAGQKYDEALATWNSISQILDRKLDPESETFRQLESAIGRNLPLEDIVDLLLDQK